MLTPEQESFIRKNHSRLSVKKIAKQTGASAAEIEPFIDSLKSSDQKRRERVFRLIILAFPFVVVCLLEAGLRIGNYGVDTSLFDETKIGTRQVYEVNEHAAEKYFRAVKKEGGFSSDMFTKVKAPNTIRIFVLGESAARGYPYMFNGAFSGMLKDRLQTVLPGKEIEVINLGLTAISSFVVLDFTKQLLEYQPDLVLIYTGHNEFYGAFAVGSSEYLGKSRGVIKAYFWLERFKTFVLLRNVIASAAGLFGGGADATHGTLMQRMVRDREIAYGGSEYETALSNFRANLEEIVRDCKAHNVPVVMGTLAANLRGMAPFVSAFSKQTTSDKRRQWEESYSAATQLYSIKEYEKALDALQTCASIDVLPAKGDFLRGQCLEAMGRYTDALDAYSAARDHDGLPFRAPASFNAMITDLCAQQGVLLAPTEQMVAARSAHGIIGQEMLLEHVHLNLEGYFTVAKAYFKAIADAKPIAAATDWHMERDKSDSVYRTMIGVTPFDSTIAAMRLQILLKSWPFTQTSITVTDVQTHNELERRAKAFLAGDEGWEQAHVSMADYYASRKDLPHAAEEYRALVKALPYSVSPYLRLAQTQVALHDTVGAETTLVHSLLVEPTFAGNEILGFIYFNKADFRRCVDYLEQANAFGADAPADEARQVQRVLNTARKRGNITS